MLQNFHCNRSFSSSEFRQSPRSDSSLGTVAELLVNRTLERRTDSIKGLVMDDSFEGCGLVLATQQPPLVGQRCYLNLSNLESLTVEVIWVEPVDESIYRIGLKYAEIGA